MVDDFGTGYSTLSYLKRLPVSGVKVDRSFVATITDDPVDASIVRAIVDACRATGRTCVAEGVERPSQGRLLRALGVDVLQGDLLGRAAPLATYASSSPTDGWTWTSPRERLTWGDAGACLGEENWLWRGGGFRS